MNANVELVAKACIALCLTAKPEAVNATLVLRDRHQPKVQLTFKLFEPSLQIVRITANIYRNDNSNPIHRQNLEYEYGKLDYQCEFLVPQLIHYKQKDMYKSAVEVEYEMDGKKAVVSNLINVEKQLCKYNCTAC